MDGERDFLKEQREKEEKKKRDGARRAPLVYFDAATGLWVLGDVFSSHQKLPTSTWWPHCAPEMPHATLMNASAKTLQSKWWWRSGFSVRERTRARWNSRYKQIVVKDKNKTGQATGGPVRQRARAGREPARQTWPAGCRAPGEGYQEFVYKVPPVILSCTCNLSTKEKRPVRRTGRRFQASIANLLRR